MLTALQKIGKSTPYSFVAALPSSLYPQIPSGNDILVNKWLAEDINAGTGDSVEMKWFVTGLTNNLEEKKSHFKINGIVDMEGIWSDPLLMPDFPGISGSESCAGWDAGIPVSLDKIRKKDEEYWNKFKGTPKAFINYDKGKELWGNNFGPATSIRFPSGLSEAEIKTKLEGVFDPDKSGFTIRDLKNEGINAANEGVDFSTLFLSLGFFIIISCAFLLSLIVSVYFDSRKRQIDTLWALGFPQKKISNLLFYETLTISVAGTLIGMIAGGLFNFLTIKALNSVWVGAVQTNTLKASFNIVSMISGFAISIFVALLFLKVKIWNYLKKLNLRERGIYKGHSVKKNFWFLILSAFLSIVLLLLSFLLTGNATALAFAGGSILLITFILAARQYVLTGNRNRKNNFLKTRSLSRSYFAFYPSHITTPVLFIATGLFILIATGANRKDFSREDFFNFRRDRRVYVLVPDSCTNNCRS